jgi:Xaa-Pro aminopeptidase
MKHRKSTRGYAMMVASILLINIHVFNVGGQTNRESTTSSSASAIRVTPPPPQISDEEWLTELRGRRARVAERIGTNGVMILFSAEPRVYTGDVDYEYRQENNLYYLTRLRQKGATLVLMPGHGRTREILFLPRRNPAEETWTGRMYSAQEAARRSGINEIWDESAFAPFMQALRNRQPYRPAAEAILMSSAGSNSPANNSNAASGYEAIFAAARRNESALYMLAPENEQTEGALEHREWRQEQHFAAQWGREAANSGFTLRSAFPIFAELRLRKSDLEIRILQHAIDITIEALGRSMAAAGTASWEYEVEAEVEYTFRRRNADYWGYPSIVGCGPNGTTLHYQESQGRVAQGDLLLMDVGAEYDHYTADVTRTFPVSGRFTPQQREIYDLVLAAQEAGMRAIRPGQVTMGPVHAAAVETIKDGLLRLGLITDRNSNQYTLWFMHGTSHYLGMNVHDVGGRATLEPGMVFTIEPGIYIREDALDHLPRTPENERFIRAVRPAFERYKNIGVRIEDDVVITAEGFRNLSIALPRTASDVENFITRARRELPRSAFFTGERAQTAAIEIRPRIFGPPVSASADDMQRSFLRRGFPVGLTVRRGMISANSVTHHFHNH